MFDLPIISNNNWICTLSNHSNSLVCSRCLRPLGDFQSDLFNTLSLQIEDKLINEPFKSNLLHMLESDVFHPQQKRVINKNEGPVRPLLWGEKKSFLHMLRKQTLPPSHELLRTFLLLSHFQKQSPCIYNERRHDKNQYLSFQLNCKSRGY